MIFLTPLRSFSLVNERFTYGALGDAVIRLEFPNLAIHLSSTWAERAGEGAKFRKIFWLLTAHFFRFSDLVFKKF
ncbi:MAG: hypothetical protein HUU45_13165 [Leptospiraceae bacterium]|nr:hypothetical protein [Leptospiraceae bacterium]